MSSNQKAKSRSFDAVSETCPILDKKAKESVEQVRQVLSEYLGSKVKEDAVSDIEDIINDLIKGIKEDATYPLRDALTEAYSTVVSLEEDIESKDTEIEELKENLEKEQEANLKEAS